MYMYMYMYKNMCKCKCKFKCECENKSNTARSRFLQSFATQQNGEFGLWCYVVCCVCSVEKCVVCESACGVMSGDVM